MNFCWALSSPRRAKAGASYICGLLLISCIGVLLLKTGDFDHTTDQYPASGLLTLSTSFLLFLLLSANLGGCILAAFAYRDLCKLLLIAFVAAGPFVYLGFLTSVITASIALLATAVDSSFEGTSGGRVEEILVMGGTLTWVASFILGFIFRNSLARTEGSLKFTFCICCWGGTGMSSGILPIVVGINVAAGGTEKMVAVLVLTITLCIVALVALGFGSYRRKQKRKMSAYALPPLYVAGAAYDARLEEEVIALATTTPCFIAKDTAAGPAHKQLFPTRHSLSVQASES